jgi:hypothetical protein
MKQAIFIFFILLTLLLLGANCAGGRGAGPSQAAPLWVDDCRKHPGTRGAVMCAVGISDFTDPISRRADAETSARAELAKNFSSQVTVMEQSFTGYLKSRGHETDEQMLNSVHSILSNIRLADSEILDRWLDPRTQYEYALGVYRVADFKGSVARMAEEDPVAVRALLENPEALFEPSSGPKEGPQ